MNKKTLLFLMMILLLPLKVRALNGNIVLKCNDTTLLSGSKSTCYLTGDFNEEISSFHGKINLGNNLSLSSIEKDSSWEGLADGGVIDLYTDKNKSSEIKFVTFIIEGDNISLDKNTSILVDDITIGDSSFKENEFNDISLDIKITSNNNNNNNNNNDNNNDNSDNDNESNNENLPNNSSSSSSGNNSSLNKNENVTENPKTGNYIVFIIGCVAIIALIGSLLYRKKVGESK